MLIKIIPYVLLCTSVLCSELDNFLEIRNCIESADSVKLTSLLEAHSADLNQIYTKAGSSEDEKVAYNLLMEAVELCLNTLNEFNHLECIEALLDHGADPFVNVDSRYGPISAWWVAGGDTLHFVKDIREPILELRKQLFSLFVTFHEEHYPDDTDDQMIDRFIPRLFPEDFCDFSLDMARSIPKEFFKALNKPGNAHLALYIVIKDNPKVYFHFKKMGLRFDVPIEDGLLPLMYLVAQPTTNYSTRILHAMLKDPSVLDSLDKTDDSGFTALMHAVIAGNVEVSLALLRMGADPNIVNPKNKRVALSFALKLDDLELARALISFGANANMDLEYIQKLPTFSQL